MAAMSFTPRQRFSSPTIILSLLPSPLSATVVAGASASSSKTWDEGSSSLGGGRFFDRMEVIEWDETIARERDLSGMPVHSYMKPNLDGWRKSKAT